MFAVIKSSNVKRAIIAVRYAENRGQHVNR